MRATLSILLDLVGIAALTVGGWWLAPWVGMVVLGLGCIVAAWAIDPPKRTAFELPPEEPADSGADANTNTNEPAAAVAPPGLDWNIP